MVFQVKERSDEEQRIQNEIDVDVWCPQVSAIT